MGHFTMTCSLSNLPLFEGEEVVSLLGLPERGMYLLETLPVVGPIDAYGRVKTPAYELDSYSRPILDVFDWSHARGRFGKDIKGAFRAIGRGEGFIRCDSSSVKVFRFQILKKALDVVTDPIKAKKDASRIIELFKEKKLDMIEHYAGTTFIHGTDIMEDQIRSMFYDKEIDILKEGITLQEQIVQFYRQDNVNIRLRPSYSAGRDPKSRRHLDIMAMFYNVGEELFKDRNIV